MRQWMKLIEDAQTPPEPEEEEYRSPAPEVINAYLDSLKAKTNKPELKRWIDTAARKYLVNLVDGMGDDINDRIKKTIEIELNHLNTVDDLTDIGRFSFGDVRDARVIDKKNAFKGPKITKINTNSPAFKAWFGDSKAVDQFGEPLVLYRGVQRPHTDSEGWETKRPSLSFTPSSDVASIYSAKRDQFTGEPDFRKGASVFPVYLSLQNPVDFSNQQKVSFTDLAWHLKSTDLEDEDTQSNILQLIHDLQHMEDEEGIQFQKELPSAGWGEMDWDEFAEKVERLFERGKFEAAEDLLANAEVDTYAVIDTETFTNWAYDKGYDGVIHLDNFDGGAVHAPALLGKEADDLHAVDSDNDNSHLTYRPFAPESQVKSIYNKGTWDPNKFNMNETKKGR